MSGPTPASAGLSPGDFSAALDAFRAASSAPTPDPAPDLGLNVGTPLPPPTPTPSLDDIKFATGRARLLDGTDTTTGAPVEVRALVGAAKGDQDRLSTLRSYYPDATPLPGSANFVYTDPGSGLRRTYAPMGYRIPTVGDIASVGREISQGVGGVAGAALGAPSGPVGAAAGGGLGAAAGDQAYQALMRFLGMSDTRSLPQQFSDAATTAGVNAVAPAVGKAVLGPMIGALTPAATPTATATAAQALQDSGLAPDLLGRMPAGVAGESVPVQKVEQAIMGLPLTGGVRQAYVDTNAALSDAAQAAAARAAGGPPVPEPQSFGANVSSIAQNIDAAWQRTRLAADDYATQQVGETTPVNLDGPRALLAQLMQQQSAAGLSLAPRYEPAITQLENLIDDADKAGGTLPFQVVRNIRSDLGDRIDWTASGNDVPTGVPALKQVYGTLKDSLLDTADQQGPQAYAALAEHDGMVSRYNAPSGPAETFKDLQNPDLRSNKLMTMTQSTTPGDAASLGQILNYATPTQRQQIASGVLGQFGTKPDGTFDMSTWLRNYGKVTPAARTMLFGPQDTGLQADLDNLVTVQRSMAQSAASKNFPNTAGALAVINALGAIGGDVASGELGAAAGAAASTFAGPPLVGKMLSSQPFVRWLSGTGAVNPANGAAWGDYLGRLGGVAVADPSIADAVTALRRKLPEQLPPAPAQP